MPRPALDGAGSDAMSEGCARSVVGNAVMFPFLSHGHRLNADAMGRAWSLPMSTSRRLISDASGRADVGVACSRRAPFSRSPRRSARAACRRGGALAEAEGAMSVSMLLPSKPRPRRRRRVRGEACSLRTRAAKLEERGRNNVDVVRRGFGALESRGTAPRARSRNVPRSAPQRHDALVSVRAGAVAQGAK